jgi:tRNA (guanine-N7-)-methyltransferase
MIRKKIRSFVLREGRFTKAQREAIEQLMPVYGLLVGAQRAVPGHGNAVPLQFNQIFQRDAETILEIGFGMGDTLVAMAEQELDKNFIGIEVFRPGIGAILNQIHTKQLKNIRIIHGDAVEVLQNNIADHSLAKIQIFFPDPWPKRRHHKRRLIQPEFIDLVRRKLKPNGILHIATDWEDYAKYITKILDQAKGWHNLTEKNQFNRPITKFEQKGKKLKHQIWEVIYQVCYLRSS